MYELITKNGYNMHEVSSMVQKAIRRSLPDDAFFAANELSSKFRAYLWRRLTTVSAEDCYGFTSKYVHDLMIADPGVGSECIEKAVSFLLHARKCRDADFFVCNLLNSRDKISLSSIEPTLTDVCESNCPTKNGHSMFDASSALYKSILMGNAQGSGYAANELMVRYRKFLWQTLLKTANAIGGNELREEVVALKALDLGQSFGKGETNLYVAKAIVVMLRAANGINDMVEPVYDYGADLASYDRVHRTIPEYVFDCHTMRGKRKGKTKRQFVTDEFNALVPRVPGMYDGWPWDRYFELLEIGFYDKENLTPRPDDRRMKDLQNGVLQLNLFDE